MSTHPDLPDTLVHFTGRPRGKGDPPPPDFAVGTPEQRLVSILHSGTLRGSPDYWADAPVICFSEVTEEARRVMLRDGAGRGPYAPWGLVLDRQKLIGAGVRPVLYLSGEEMGATGQLPTRLRNRRVRYDPGQSDWLHEREWRFCFEDGAEPVLPITPQPVGAAGVVSFTPHLVIGVIVGTPGWTPPPREVSPEEMSSKYVTAVLAVRRAMKENSHLAWTSIPISSPPMSFAWPANGLARWHWNGAQLVPDGYFDIRTQQELEATCQPGLSGTVHPEDVWEELRGDGRV
ncbi:hypothetical protein ACIRJM_21950 [Streptomyces sp. NPDC102405]|uniref:hypothetical protein n=1 Tax=Streptomyces sp. NPDC102405 TaxID=3366170 RepID=UPI0037F5CE16